MRGDSCSSCALLAQSSGRARSYPLARVACALIVLIVRRPTAAAPVLAQNCRGVILSWAVPGQIGHAHVNNHKNRYVIRQMEGLGYRLHDNLTAALRSSSNEKSVVNHWWLRRTLMAFERRVPLVSDPSLPGAACRPSVAQLAPTVFHPESVP